MQVYSNFECLSANYSFCPKKGVFMMEPFNIPLTIIWTLNWIRVTMKLPILDPECRSPIRTSLPMTFQGELGISNSGHLSLRGTGRHFWKCGTPTVAVDENVSDCEVVSLPFTPHPLPILWQYAWTFAWPRAPGCISMPCAGYWLGQMLSSPHQPRLSACGSVWLFDVTCVSLFLSLLFRCFPSHLLFFKC